VQLLFASTWVDRREIVFHDKQNHSNPSGKGHEINDKMALPQGEV